MPFYTVVIRAAADGHEQDLTLEADNRERAWFAVGHILGAHYAGVWDVVKLTEYGQHS